MIKVNVFGKLVPLYNIHSTFAKQEHSTSCVCSQSCPHSLLPFRASHSLGTVLSAV